jgi:hypothetical protein
LSVTPWLAGWPNGCCTVTLEQPVTVAKIAAATQTNSFANDK